MDSKKNDDFPIDPVLPDSSEKVILSQNQIDEINALKPDFYIDKKTSKANISDYEHFSFKFPYPAESLILILGDHLNYENYFRYFIPFQIEQVNTRVTYQFQTGYPLVEEKICCILFTKQWFDNNNGDNILSDFQINNPFIRKILLILPEDNFNTLALIGSHNYDTVFILCPELAAVIPKFIASQVNKYYQELSQKERFEYVLSQVHDKTEEFKQLKQKLSKAIILISNKNTQLNQQKNEIESQRADLEKALKSSTKHYVRLQKSLILNQEQQHQLEKAIKEMAFLNEQLKIQNEEVLTQRDEIEKQQVEIQAQNDYVIKQYNRIAEQQTELTDNLIYSQRIQKAILPQEDFLSILLPYHFIVNLPRNIVSGDFYWITQNRSKTIIAVGDATGHGVSGALMSMLGIAYLNEIINKDNIQASNEILDKLRKQVVKSLHQSAAISDSKDGFDMSVCVIDLEKNTLQYSGANNPMYIIRDGLLHEMKADKMPIGFHERLDHAFSFSDFDLQPGDMIYMFSDGFADQFGGPKETKFKLKPFKSMFTTISSLSMEEQKSAIIETFLKWKGKHEQVDDILILGFRYP